MDRTSFGTFSALSACLAVLLTTGCGDTQSSPPTVNIPPTGGQTQASTQQLSPTAGPQETVGHYLEAVRIGDAGIVNNLLTTVAREKTAEMNISVAPPGSDTARFEVGQLRYVTENQGEAHVDSKWIELDDTGVEQTHEITWIMREEALGWRVAGMMGKFVAGQPIMVFNFEDPQEVIRQRDASDEMSQQSTTDLQAQQTEPQQTTRQ